MMNLTGAILAGGKGRRLKGNKAFLKLNGSWVLEMQVRELKKICNEILIVGNLEIAKPKICGVKYIDDLVYGLGPVGGIYSALKEAQNDKVFVTGCDMPYINSNLIRILLANLENYDLVVPIYNKLIEPLYAIFTKGCLTFIETSLKEKNLTIRGIIEKAKSRYIIFDEIGHKYNFKKVFLNINTKGDLRRASRYA